MKKKVYRERYFKFLIDDVNEYKKGAIEKIIENINAKETKPKKKKKSGK